MQIYGIDLSKEKFDVSFCKKTTNSVGKPSHMVVRNTPKGIAKFLDSLPQDAVLVAEHTGVYGARLLKSCTDRHIRIAYVGGHVIHTYKSSPDRGKTDELDCAVLRDFGERFSDRLKFSTFPEKDLDDLRQLATHRSRLVDARKRLMTADRGEDCRPYRNECVKESLKSAVSFFDKQIADIEEQMLQVIDRQEKLLKNYKSITSVKGVGMVTAVEMIIKTNNFTTITTAAQYAAYAGTAPYEKSSGQMNHGAHISRIGNRRSKTLLYTCAECARLHNKEIMLYYERRTVIDKKPRYYVLNAIANKLLRIIFALIAKGETFDDKFIREDPRKIKHN